jgi:VIT1/CCC1 family predicted Fe2+/Mn2+ transporter
MMIESAFAKFPRNLEPMDRISEILFGVIMALTFTLTFAVATADNMAVRTMLFAALGCNLAWGIIDGGVYLLARLNQHGRAIRRWRAVRDAPDAATAQRLIADDLPPLLASIAESAQLEAIRQKLRRLPEPAPVCVAKDDWLGALGIFLLSFLSTLPIVIPFLLVGDARLALRISNAVAIAMLFGCGFVFGRYAGIRPVAMGVAMVAIGCTLVGVAIALGG